MSGPGDNVLTVGFVVGGDLPSKILIRGIGPGLVPFGVSGSLDDPQLILRDSRGVLVAQNDDWDSAETGIAQRVGAFPLPAGSRDAGIVITVVPGAYTVQLAGSGPTPRIALLELYQVP